MENKLQELTQKLYNEGLSKGQQEADVLIAVAKKEADAIVNEANKKAAELIKTAEVRAAELRKNTEAELTMTCRQVLGDFRKQIEQLITLKSVSPAVSAANNDVEFVKSLLLSIAASWNAQAEGKVELQTILPESKRAELAQFIADATQKNLTAGLDITFDNRVKSGFKIGPKDGGYYISFSDADFDALLKDYLRPQVSKLLFSGE